MTLVADLEAHLNRCAFSFHGAINVRSLRSRSALSAKLTIPSRFRRRMLNNCSYPNGPGLSAAGCAAGGSENGIQRRYPASRETEASGKGEEQSYEPIVPLKAGNRRATLEVAATGPAGGKG